MLKSLDLILLRCLLDKTMMISNSFWPNVRDASTKLWRCTDTKSNKVERLTQFSPRDTPRGIAITEEMNRITVTNEATSENVSRTMRMIEDVD